MISPQMGSFRLGTCTCRSMSFLWRLNPCFAIIANLLKQKNKSQIHLLSQGHFEYEHNESENSANK